MPFESKRPKLNLSKNVCTELENIAKSRSIKIAKVQRAQMILAYFHGESISKIAQQFKTNRPKIERLINKALQIGAIPALDDLHRTGKAPEITAEDRAWFLSIACQKPKEFGYAAEIWTFSALAKHIHKTCKKNGHPSLSKLSKGTISKILSKSEIQPHKIRYYLERRDPNFDNKMAQVLHVYKEVEMQRALSPISGQPSTVYLSYDEKPGLQAIKNVAPDLPPVLGAYKTFSRDHEYVRLGTVSILASIDLVTGQIHGQVTDRRRSKEFIEHLKLLDKSYSKDMKIKLVLDNHSAHISKETQTFLSSKPNRFEFIFTPTHGSWLNIIEMFFSKMSRSVLRYIRVDSIDELKSRLSQYFKEVNRMPIIFRWKFKMDEISI